MRGTKKEPQCRLSTFLLNLQLLPLVQTHSFDWLIPPQPYLGDFLWETPVNPFHPRKSLLWCLSFLIICAVLIIGLQLFNRCLPDGVCFRRSTNVFYLLTSVYIKQALCDRMNTKPSMKVAAMVCCLTSFPYFFE